MDGRGRWRDNVHIERLWRNVKYEDIYLEGYENLRALKRGLASYFDFLAPLKTTAFGGGDVLTGYAVR